MGGPTGAREIGPHRGGGGKREKAISPGRGGAEEEIVNAHLSLGLEIIPIVHRNYDGWTIRWCLPARRPTWDHEFESDFLQRRVQQTFGSSAGRSTSISGRQALLAVLRQFLSRPEQRLPTIHFGPDLGGGDAELAPQKREIVNQVDTFL